jgi:hypothetical protein
MDVGGAGDVGVGWEWCHPFARCARSGVAGC